jgi:hypothetical protein
MQVMVLLGELTSSLRIRSIIQRASKTHFAMRTGDDESFEVASAALLQACDERWRTVLSKKPTDIDTEAVVADLKIIALIESIADSFSSEYTCPTSNWAKQNPAVKIPTAPVISIVEGFATSSATASLSSSNNPATASPLDGTWRLRFSTHPDSIRRTRKYHKGANLYEFADARMGSFASVVSFNETQHRFRRELRKVKCLAPLSETSMRQTLCRVEVLFRSPVALPRLTIPVLQILLLPFKRASVVEILYINDDFLLTKEDDNYYSIRTRLYQAWDPGSPTGWVYVSGV